MSTNPLINHLEKTLLRTQARVAELQAMLNIVKQIPGEATADPRQAKLPTK